MRDEELTAAGVLPVERHAHGPAQVWSLVDLVSNRVAWPAFTVSARVAVLHDEVGHDAMNRNPGEESFTSERDEVGDGQRRIEHRQFELDGPLVCLDERTR